MIIKPDLDDDLNVGRFGNKLFIVASMIGWAIRNHSTFMLPHWKYEKSLPLLPVHDILPVADDTYKEEAFSYNKIPCFGADRVLQVSGYFQSWKYFVDAEEEVFHYFTPSMHVYDDVVDYLKTHGLTDKRRCVIQVRRGDYLTNLKDHYSIQESDYYSKALDKMKHAGVYMVFSDDLHWCRENFKGSQYHFVDTGNNVLDLFLQANCHDHIIGNSSFGWWGAWLNNSKEKRVIAPKNWFGPKLLKTHNDKDLIPDKWRRM